MRAEWIGLAAVVLGGPVAAQELLPQPLTRSCGDGREVLSEMSCDTKALPGPFIVFFPWGEMGIDADAAEIVDAAAQAFRAQQADGLRLTLAGHSDTSGPASVNRRISQKRAEAVHDALVAKGVPREAMRIDVQGEASLLIGTSDSTREAQNRRVEILFSHRAN